MDQNFSPEEHLGPVVQEAFPLETSGLRRCPGSRGYTSPAFRREACHLSSRIRGMGLNLFELPSRVRCELLFFKVLFNKIFG